MSQRKYYASSAYKDGKPVSICYRSTWNILAASVYSRTIYFYKENEKYYEFFSGIVLAEGVYGKEHEPKGEQGKLIIPESTLEIRISELISWGQFRSNELTPSKFADEVKKYMKEQKSISSQINNLLQSSHVEWVEKQKQLNAEIIAKNTKETNDQSWLDSILNSRK